MQILPQDPNTLLAMSAALIKGMNEGVLPPQLAALTTDQQKQLLQFAQSHQMQQQKAHNLKKIDQAYANNTDNLDNSDSDDKNYDGQKRRLFEDDGDNDCEGDDSGSNDEDEEEDGS